MKPFQDWPESALADAWNDVTGGGLKVVMWGQLRCQYREKNPVFADILDFLSPPCVHPPGLLWLEEDDFPVEPHHPALSKAVEFLKGTPYEVWLGTKELFVPDGYTYSLSEDCHHARSLELVQGQLKIPDTPERFDDFLQGLVEKYNITKKTL